MGNGYAKFTGIGGSGGGGGGGTPGGANTSVQFNNGGSFGGFGTWDGTTLSVPGTVSATGALVAGGNLHVFGTSIAAGDFVVQGGFSASGNLGFYGATEIAQPSGNILTALSTLNLVSTPTMPFGSLTGQASLTQLPTLASDTILGNNTGGSTTPSALTVAQVNAILPVFTSTLNGLAPLSGGGTTNFLRADGSWAAPSGGGSVTSVGLSAPAAFTVGGSPVTGSGTLALTYSGSAIPVANGGTGQTSNIISPTATTFASWDANKDLSANSFNSGYTTTVTSATPVVLTIASTQTQVFTGSTAQTVTLPVASTLVNGQSYIIINLSSAAVTVNSSGANAIQVMPQNTKLTLFLQNTAGGTTAAAWTWEYTTAQSTALSIAVGGTAKTAVTTAATATSWAGWDGNLNMSASGFIPGFTTVATAAGTTTLTIASKETNVFTGTTTQIVKLPTTSVAQGQQYTIINLSTGAVTVEASGGTTLATLSAGQQAVCTALIATPTTNANWTATIQNISGLASAPTNAYWSGNMSTSSSWSTSSGTFADPTVSGSVVFTATSNSGFGTVTAAGSSLPGITFTPASSTAVYLVTFTSAFSNSLPGAVAAARITDGTAQVASCSLIEPVAGNAVPFSMTGIYAPGTASPVTLKIQLAIAVGGSATLQGQTPSNAVEFTLVRIA